jgi:hypothetical protein
MSEPDALDKEHELREHEREARERDSDEREDKSSDLEDSHPAPPGNVQEGNLSGS